ncbi:ribosomal protein S18 acetylase RimI-like enzyme [Psychrobacillus insolitus]|uniref:Ribosomal protein S18 acetylase RimI-like enzyme n=1 Tax=Psychrobacillus insolitus TaxID=1461 RepID=A0A2W7MHC3_9BACI|nr:GNAT family N-acetyltransferase [Psychrobacillus insolitus]PZX05938.1 ribosomal protein S18 acetylase RimI-like enzyme [Psychrobacillus insolitus]
MNNIDNIKIEINDCNISLNKDVFNSDHFGIKMGNINIENFDVTISDIDLSRTFESLIEKAKEAKFKHLTFKIDTNNKQLVKCVEKKQFSLADTLITYLFDFKKSILPEMNHKCILGDCKEEDIETLKEISRTSFQIDRFHSDDSLDNYLCDTYYEKWIENSFNGFADKVIVAYFNEVPVGYTTGKVYDNEKYGHLVLSAVSSESRGLGVYTSMIYEGVHWMKNEYANKVDGLLVGTQINNIAVQKAWIKLGFSVFDSQYVFQKLL